MERALSSKSRSPTLKRSVVLMHGLEHYQLSRTIPPSAIVSIYGLSVLGILLRLGSSIPPVGKESHRTVLSRGTVGYTGPQNSRTCKVPDIPLIIGAGARIM